MTVVAPVFLQGAAGQNSANYGTFFIADRPYQITGAAEFHGAPSTSGVVYIYKTYFGSGVDLDILSADFSTSNSPGQPRFGQLITGASTDLLTLQRGDRLHLSDSGNLANLLDLLVLVYLRPI